MIFVFLLFTIISVIVFHCVCKYYQSIRDMPTALLAICLASIFTGVILFSSYSLAYIKGNTNLLMYKGTISKEEFTIVNYQEVKTTSEDNKTKVSYTYTVKNTNNKKTVSAKDTSVYSISVLNSSNRVNHLTVKHNAYFNWTTFTTTLKDEYLFSSK